MRRRRRDNTLNLFAFQDIITGVAGVMLFVLLLLVVQMSLKASVESGQLQGMASATQPEPEPQPPAYDPQQLHRMRDQLDQLRRQGARLLADDADDLNAKIRAAEAELDQLMQEARSRRSQAKEIDSRISSEETSQQKAKALARRDALRQQLRQLEQEQAQHASGKLVAFKSATPGQQELWMIDIRGTRALIFNVQSPGDAATVTYKKLEPPSRIVRSVTDRLKQQTKQRSIVVLLRPTAAGIGPELLDAFRQTGYRVALEILDEDTLVAAPSKRESS